MVSNTRTSSVLTTEVLRLNSGYDLAIHALDEIDDLATGAMSRSALETRFRDSRKEELYSKYSALLFKCRLTLYSMCKRLPLCAVMRLKSDRRLDYSAFLCDT